MAGKFVANACPRDLDPSISLPVSRLLARVRLALAELRLTQVCWCDQRSAAAVPCPNWLYASPPDCSFRLVAVFIVT
jgi:hypothetical protein